jgi:hypothetical protein
MEDVDPNEMGNPISAAGHALTSLAAADRIAGELTSTDHGAAEAVEAAETLIRLSSSPPSLSDSQSNAESPRGRFISMDTEQDRTIDDYSDVDTLSGESTLTWQSTNEENRQRLEPILEPLGLCRRNPPRASRPTDMRG